jgi:hypothetical protein
MATARSTPAAGFAAARTLAGKPAAKVAPTFRRVGCAQPFLSVVFITVQLPRGGLNRSAVCVQKQGRINAASGPLFLAPIPHYVAPAAR